MKQHLLAFGLGAGAVFLTAQIAAAQANRNCAARETVVEQLATQFGESRRSIGLGANNQVVEVFASEETGTWTITVTLPSGLTCLIAAGEGFEQLDEELTPASLGEPA